MRSDHRPYWIKKIHRTFEQLYLKYRLRPQFDKLGENITAFKPWYVEIFGSPISIGDFTNIIATSDQRIRLCIWSDEEKLGNITLGKCCLICPGVRITSASSITIGDNCMIASNSYITDSDWHDIYNRVSTGNKSPVNIKNNVWIGDSVTICKGVTIGDNSIIGVRSVVTNSIPSNSIAVGNPAKVIKQLDPNKELITREHWFSDPKKLFEEIDQIDRERLDNNTLIHWLRVIMFPTYND